jgi:hypothetical protein
MSIEFPYIRYTPQAPSVIKRRSQMIIDYVKFQKQQWLMMAISQFGEFKPMSEIVNECIWKQKSQRKRSHFSLTVTAATTTSIHPEHD